MCDFGSNTNAASFDLQIYPLTIEWQPVATVSQGSNTSAVYVCKRDGLNQKYIMFNPGSRSQAHNDPFDACTFKHIPLTSLWDS